MKYFLKKPPLIFILLSCLFSCRSDPEKTPTESSQYESASGRKLAKLYCASCHQFPEPSQLPVEIWEKTILPRMGYMYGFYDSEVERNELFEDNEGGQILRNSNLFPPVPTIDSLTWEKIKSYYLSNAPDSIKQPKPLQIHPGTSLFKTMIPKQKVKVPSSTMAQFTKRGTVYLGDAFTRSFSEFSQGLQLLNTGNVPEGAVWVNEVGQTLWLTVMGSFSPTDAPKGMLAKIPKNGNLSIPIKGLQRPVHSSMADFDEDGDLDIVVCEFGKWTGALSLFENKGNDQFQKQVLHPFPGAVKAYVEDMNGDGLLDIVALFAQADEGIDIFYNQGGLSFQRERVLQFPPSMGTSFFRLKDYNNDGHVDILLTAGDNADYYPILKPWHGVYLYENNGDNSFTEIQFLHLNGAYNAVVEDFDLDGDLDIAAISFFPDWANNPKEGFVYFENKDGNYIPSTIHEVNWGRWIVMDSMDYDADGDIDLVLGSLAFEALPKLGFEEIWMEKGIPFIILNNQIR